MDINAPPATGWKRNAQAKSRRYLGEGRGGWKNPSPENHKAITGPVAVWGARKKSPASDLPGCGCGASAPFGRLAGRCQWRSKRSRFITLVQAATKSRVNFSAAPLAAYTSATARNSELEPNTRSTGVAVHLTLPVARSRPSYRPGLDGDFDQAVDMSSRLTKKSLLRVPGLSVNTPWLAPPAFASRARMPPTSTVISGTVRVKRFARSTSISAGDRVLPSAK